MLSDLLRDQVQGRSKNDIEELTLDGWHCAEMSLSDKSLLEEFSDLEFLSMNNCGLVSLKNFPRLPQLIKLDLNDNKIVNGLQHLAGLPNLMQLGLAGNLIKAFTEVDLLVLLTQVKTPKLLAVDLERCPVTQNDGYREHVFDKLKSLSVLDGADEQGNEVVDSEEDDDEALNPLLNDDDDDEIDEDDEVSDSEDEAIHLTKGSKRVKPTDSDSEEELSDESEDEPEPIKKRK